MLENVLVNLLGSVLYHEKPCRLGACSRQNIRQSADPSPLPLPSLSSFKSGHTLKWAFCWV
ncbi:hypothetical protein AXX17_AT2G26880 [Arabidopsis thaliana]|uniref:Uncharacterized protein n=1 Tax=Arabidopsis thaliana TaxID=3702 RepID=A0A178VY36_ARATH|nr:hypothetical protein AXX17_AT2G26880 [Arabidopsis thaliana]